MLPTCTVSGVPKRKVNGSVGWCLATSKVKSGSLRHQYFRTASKTPIPASSQFETTMTEIIKEVITDGKYVELKYQVIDVKTDSILTEVEFPLGYVHGVNEVLAPAVMKGLEGKAAGDT